MKKMRLICVSVLALGLAFIASSCKKDQETASITVTTSTLEEEDNDARVYVDFSDRNRMKWNANDRIMIYNLDPTDGNAAIVQEFHTDASAEGEITATFHGPAVGAPQSDLGYFFFYPAAMTSAAVDEDNRATFTVGDTQHYTELRTKKGAVISTIEPGTMAQAATSQDLHFQMNNIFGVARVYLMGNQEVVKVELIDNTFNLTGSAKVCLPNVDAATMLAYVEAYKQGAISYLDMYDYLSDMLLYYPMPTGTMMTLDCSNYTDANGEVQHGVQLTNPDAKSFMFCLRPGALSNGFTLRVYYSDHTGTEIEFDTENLENPREYCIVPGRIKGIRLKVDGYETAVDGLDDNGNPLFPTFTW